MLFLNNIPVPPPLPQSSPPKTVANESENYKKGHATELLEESVKNLKVSQQEDFRSNAGKIISFMLENRLADSKNGVPNRYENSRRMADAHPMKKIIDICDVDTNTKTQIGYDNKPLLSPTLVKANSPDINDNLTDFPLPPPIPSTPVEDLNLNNYLPSPPPPPPTSDELDPPVFDYKYFSATTKPSVKSPPKSPPVKSSPQPSHSVSPKSVENDDIPKNVVVRNRDSRSELSTHARDRRSYIEKDMLGNENYSQNVIDEEETTDLANKLKDGKHPVCTCCNTKITR